MAKRRRRDRVDGSVGIGVDYAGGAVIDPTANVIALSVAANKRQDDLREASERLSATQVSYLENIIDIRTTHMREVSALQAAHERELQRAEIDRQTSIRAIDVAGLQNLALRSSADSENLRKAIQDTATTLASQTDATFNAVIDRIAALEKQAYLGEGSRRVEDPQMAAFVDKMQRGADAIQNNSGVNKGIGISWGAIVGAGSLVVVLILGVNFISNFNHPTTTTAPTAGLQIPQGYVLVPSTPPQQNAPPPQARPPQAGGLQLPA